MAEFNNNGRSSVLQARALQAFNLAIGSRRRLIVGIVSSRIWQRLES